MSDLAKKLIREDLKDLKPYESARRLFAMADSSEIDTYWLNANENPYVPDVSVNAGLFNRYPDFQPEPLINAYASYAGLANEQVLATRGADEGIELLIRTFCESTDNIVINPPTYGMYKISAQTCGVNVIEVPTIDGFQLDLDNLLPKVADAKLVFICSPNNPTGQVMNKQDIITVLEAANNALVIADEAYIEFCPEATLVELINDYPNLVILRTLSKAFGLAGLRCGFTLAQQGVIDAIKKVIAPYPVPAPVAQIASQSLSEDGLTWMNNTVTELNQLKQEFIEFASQLSWIEQVYPSDTNFVLCKLAADKDANDVMQYCVDNHVLLRNQSKQIQLGNTLRVSIGSPEQMNKVKTLFAQVK